MSEIKKYIDENEKIVAEGKKDEIANVLGIPERLARRLTKKDMQDTFFFMKNYAEKLDNNREKGDGKNE